MPPVARINDTISHGSTVTGNITSGALKTFVDNLAVARVGDSAFCDIHGSVTIVTGLDSELVEGAAIAREGDSISCGAVISSGSPNESAG